MSRQIVDIAGPSGSGKNTVLEELLARYKKCTRLVTATTRTPRPGEKNGVDYYFFSEEEFFRKLKAGDILEHRDIKSLDTHYGVYKPDLLRRLAKGLIVLAQLDIIGAKFLKEHYDAITIFIMPESLDSLRERVRTRSREMPEAELRKRMKIAETEMTEHAPQFDYRIVNADGKLREAVDEVVAILTKEGYTLQ